MTADETLNELLVCLFKDLTEIEGRCLITDEFSDISINDMHIIEAIGAEALRHRSQAYVYHSGHADKGNRWSHPQGIREPYPQ